MTQKIIDHYYQDALAIWCQLFGEDDAGFLPFKKYMDNIFYGEFFLLEQKYQAVKNKDIKQLVEIAKKSEESSLDMTAAYFINNFVRSRWQSVKELKKNILLQTVIVN